MVKCKGNREYTMYFIEGYTNLEGSCFGRKASSWSDPHQAPPIEM